MATACHFIGWDRPVRGRDMEAWQHLAKEATTVLPDFGRLPLTVFLRQRKSVRALARSGNDQMCAGPDWRGDVFIPLVRKCD